MADKETNQSRRYDDWLNQKWRPMVAYSYIVVCVFDFVIAPIINFYFFGKTGGIYAQWHPLTLDGAGTYHMAMGAIVGITAWSRGQEKMEGNRQDRRKAPPKENDNEL